MENYKLDEGYIYNDSFSEKDFYDAVIENIRNDFMAPSYIFDEIIIGKIGRINVPLILTDGDSEIEYSRMIGYDSLQTTTKYKTTTYSNGYQNRTQSTSTKTITNWQKDEGIIRGTAKSGTYDEQYKIYDEYITNHKMDRKNIRLMPEDEMLKHSLKPETVEFLKNDIMNKVFANNITYPGNHVKNEEYYGNTTLYNTSCTIVSLYSLAIKVRDRELLFVACTNGEIELKLFGDYPADDFDEVLKFNREITDQRLEATKTQRTLLKITVPSMIVLFILFLILGLSLGILALTIISFVVLLAGIVITIKFGIDLKKINKPYFQQIREFSDKDFEKKRNYKEESYQSFINK